jgi:hypothetical protein
VKGFRRTSRGIAAAFDAMQAGVLRRLAGDIDELMASRGSAEPDVAPEPAPGTDPLEALFADFAAGASTRPEDPVLARLLPDGYAPPQAGDQQSDAGLGRDAGADADDDLEAAAADFRRFTEGELRARKRAAAGLIRESLPPGGGSIVLDDEQAAAWLSGLNDMRLSLGTALEVGPDTDREYERLDPMSSRARRLYLYFWLGLLQETLIDALTSA